LHSWRYIDGQNYPVSDPNNATDGDIYIASALQQAGTRWSSEIYLQAARVIAEAILAKCTIVIGGKTLLLPGVDGFAKLAHVVVNPSYYAFPLMRQLNLAFPSPVWAQLEQSGVRMISEAKFGKWSLPSDWLQVRRADGVVSMAESFPQRFSYDALRIPLFLAWSGLAPDTTKAISRFWKDGCASEPSYADLKSGAVMGRYTLLGAKSIATLIASSDVERNSLAFEEIGQTDSYYSSSLHLLTRIAAEEIGLRA
jgi:endoglucanase